MEMKNKRIYYNIYSEFYNVNKYRKLKSLTYHGNNRLNHINRVAKMSFFMSKYLHLDYVSCTRGAMMHDFFTTEDLSKNKTSYYKLLKKYINIAYNNSNEYFDVNEIEKDIILTHMFPIIKGKPHYKESKIVCICDKIVNVYEFFRYELNLAIYGALVLLAKHI